MTLARIFLGILLGATLIGTHAMAVEEPPFKIVLEDGDFEVRDYPPLVVAEVTVAGEQKTAANKGFRLLAGYIFGGNTRHESIAMTAPVAQTPTDETVAAHAPVVQILNAGTWTVQFTMPGMYAPEALPAPNDPKVRLRRLPATRVAVIRFSGLAGRGDVGAKSEALLAAIEAHHLRASGPVTLAQYDPPWTPWFMRRNEVMIPVAANP